MGAGDYPQFKPAKVERISYAESNVFVKFTKEDLEYIEELPLATTGVCPDGMIRRLSRIATQRQRVG